MGSCLSTPEVTSATTAKPPKPSASTSPPVASSQVKGGKDSEASKRIEDGKSNTMGAASSSSARPGGDSTASELVLMLCHLAHFYAFIPRRSYCRGEASAWFRFHGLRVL